MARKGDDSYRSILKGTTIFGGVQFINVLLSLVRNKFVAVILGPAGMGMSSLFNSTADSVQRIASLGLNLSIVREVSSHSDDPERLRRAVAAALRLVVLTGALGALICVLLSSVLSRFAFGDSSQTGSMMLVGAVVFLTVMWQGRMAVLQGLREVRSLSRATVIGSVTALVAGVPFYWLFGTGGIVPAMLVYAAVMFVFYAVEVRRHIPSVKVAAVWRDHLPMMRSLLVMGVLLMANDTMVSAVTYVVNVFIRWRGHLGNVGLFQAANSMTMQYIGIIFSAMAMDFLPRLSAAVKDGGSYRDIINHQTEIVTLMAAPLCVVLMILSPVAVSLLYSAQFCGAVELVRLLAMSVMLRSVIYPLGYLTFVMDNKRVFFWLEGVGCNMLTLVLNIGGYMLGGLPGLCLSMSVDMVLTWLIYIIVNRRLYGFRFSAAAHRCSFYGAVAVSLGLAASYIPHQTASYVVMTAVAAVSCVVSYRGLKKRVKNRVTVKNN